jgi:hypothetical protein
MVVKYLEAGQLTAVDLPLDCVAKLLSVFLILFFPVG